MKQKTILPRERIPNFRNFISRSTNLDDVSAWSWEVEAQQSFISLSFLLFTSSSSSQVSLVFTALSMGQVRAVILMDGEAEPAFEGTDMVFEEIGVLV